jgi:tRNA A-37 threonylcarbamoyl transferase component Bud32
VYVATHAELHHRVAVKVLTSRLDDDVRRFVREGRKLASLRHPHIVVVHDIGMTANDDPYLVMEYVDGGSLADRLRAGPLTVGEAIAIIEPVAEALAYIHEQRTIHRDIKPANILLSSTGPKLADFGIAMEMDQTATANAATLLYAAPEVLVHGSQRGNAQTDIYSLGATLYTALTGDAPFGRASDSPHDVIKRTLERRPPQVGGQPELNALIHRALAKEPGGRHPTAAAFLAELRGVTPGLPVAELRKTPERSVSPDVARFFNPESPDRATPEQLRILARHADDENLLFAIADRDRDEEATRLAIAGLTSEAHLRRLVAPERPTRVRALAAARVRNGALAVELSRDPAPEVRASLAGAVTDPELWRVLADDPDDRVMASMIGHIPDPVILDYLRGDGEPRKRRAVAETSRRPEDWEILALDHDPAVRTAAMRRLGHAELLALATHQRAEVSGSAMALVGPSDLEGLTRHASEHVGAGAIAHLDQERLGRLAGQADHPRRELALRRIGSPVILRRVTETEDERVALPALARIRDQDPRLLGELARDRTYHWRSEATAWLRDTAVLDTLTTDPDAGVAGAATSRLAELGRQADTLRNAIVTVAVLTVVVLAAAATPLLGAAMAIIVLALLWGGVAAYGASVAGWIEL